MELVYEPWWYPSWIRYLLFDVGNEVSGVLFWDDDLQQWSVSVNMQEATDEVQERFRDMVVVIPFHTHPYRCYREGDTTRGGPSLDDLLLFFRHVVANGQMHHLVFAVEGVYIMCIVDGGGGAPSAVEIESWREYFGAFSGWNKTGRYDSVRVETWCGHVTQWVRQKIPGFSVRFHGYTTRAILV